MTSDAKTLELRTAGNKVDIPGLIEYEIKNLDDVKKVMAMGDKNRSVASTKMNSTRYFNLSTPCSSFLLLKNNNYKHVLELLEPFNYANVGEFSQ